MAHYVMIYGLIGCLFYLFCDWVFKRETGNNLNFPAAIFILFLWPLVLLMWAYQLITGKGFDE